MQVDKVLDFCIIEWLPNDTLWEITFYLEDLELLKLSSCSKSLRKRVLDLIKVWSLRSDLAIKQTLLRNLTHVELYYDNVWNGETFKDIVSITFHESLSKDYEKWIPFIKAHCNTIKKIDSKNNVYHLVDLAVLNASNLKTLSCPNVCLNESEYKISYSIISLNIGHSKSLSYLNRLTNLEKLKTPIVKDCVLPTTLVKLNVEECFDKNLSNLLNLRTLIVGSSSVSLESIKALKNLELIMGDFIFEDTAKNILFPNLKYVTNYSLQNIDKFLVNHTNIEKLTLIDRMGRDSLSPEVIIKFTKLKELCLSMEQLTFYKVLKTLTKLEYLNARILNDHMNPSVNQVSFDKELFICLTLTNLRHLRVSKRIPFIPTLPNLSSLIMPMKNFDMNQLTLLSNLTEIINLFRAEQYPIIPILHPNVKSIKQFKMTLDRIDCLTNITSFSGTIDLNVWNSLTKLTNLKSLRIIDSLTNQDLFIISNHLTNLKSLTLYRVTINEAKKLSKLPKLKSLTLSINDFDNDIRPFQLFPSLKQLYIAYLRDKKNLKMDDFISDHYFEFGTIRVPRKPRTHLLDL